jgi:PTH2 family peptidyl-tRNA hydrolase
MKQVVVVRKDIKMGRGKLAVQVAHAAVECAMESAVRNSKKVEEWRRDGAKKIVVKADSLEDLFLLQESARKAKIVNYLVCDRGLTEFKEPTITCLGMGPDKDEVLDKLTGGLKLV